MRRLILNRRTFHYCDRCPERYIDQRATPKCALKERLGLDCTGIFTASDGTALNCPRC